MATSRTGTAKWKRVRAAALDAALEAGMTDCPSCGIPLDWTRSRRPNSPEADHKVPYAKGGRDEVSNVRVICRRCNQQRGALDGHRAKGATRRPVATVDLGASDHW